MAIDWSRGLNPFAQALEDGFRAREELARAQEAEKLKYAQLAQQQEQNFAQFGAPINSVKPEFVDAYLGQDQAQINLLKQAAKVGEGFKPKTNIIEGKGQETEIKQIDDQASLGGPGRYPAGRKVISPEEANAQIIAIREAQARKVNGIYDPIKDEIRIPSHQLLHMYKMQIAAEQAKAAAIREGFGRGSQGNQNVGMGSPGGTKTPVADKASLEKEIAGIRKELANPTALYNSAKGLGISRQKYAAQLQQRLQTQLNALDALNIKAGGSPSAIPPEIPGVVQPKKNKVYKDSSGLVIPNKLVEDMMKTKNLNEKDAISEIEKNTKAKKVK